MVLCLKLLLLLPLPQVLLLPQLDIRSLAQVHLEPLPLSLRVLLLFHHLLVLLLRHPLDELLSHLLRSLHHSFHLLLIPAQGALRVLEFCLFPLLLDHLEALLMAFLPEDALKVLLAVLDLTLLGDERVFKGFLVVLTQLAKSFPLEPLGLLESVVSSHGSSLLGLGALLLEDVFRVASFFLDELLLLGFLLLDLCLELLLLLRSQVLRFSVGGGPLKLLLHEAHLALFFPLLRVEAFGGSIGRAHYTRVEELLVDWG